jgi:hypothetical protein
MGDTERLQIMKRQLRAWSMGKFQRDATGTLFDAHFSFTTLRFNKMFDRWIDVNNDIDRRLLAAPFDGCSDAFPNNF